MQSYFNSIPIILLLSACSSMGTTNRMTVAELDQFKPNCAYKQEQLDFLRTQLPNPYDRTYNATSMTGVGGTVLSLWDGTYNDRRDQHTGKTEANVRSKIDYLQRWCK